MKDMNALLLFQLADSSFPNGTYGYSDGLEYYIHSKKIQNTFDLYTFLESELQLGWGKVDLLACALVLRGEPLERVAQRLNLVKLVESSRQSSLNTGNRLKKSASSVFKLMPTALEKLPLHLTHGSVVFAEFARSSGCSFAFCLQAYGHAWLMNRISAATRLCLLGGLEAQTTAHKLHPALERAIAQSLVLDLDQLYSFTPALEMGLVHHAALEIKLFQT
jgi:urease accessory protein